MEPLHNNPTLLKMKALNDDLQCGKLTQAQYDKEWRKMMVALQSRADREREVVKRWAIDTGKLRDEAEYVRLCRHYHDGIGDSFHHFLSAIHAGADFLTLNDKVLDDARLLELRFGGKILSPQEALLRGSGDGSSEA